MQISMIDGVLLVWGVSQKAPAYKQLRSAFGNVRQIIFLNQGSKVEEFDDARLARLGLKRMTVEEQAAALKPLDETTPIVAPAAEASAQ